MIANLDLYGFERRVEVTQEAFVAGRVTIAIIKPIKEKFLSPDIEAIPIDINNYAVDFYLCSDGMWRILHE